MRSSADDRALCCAIVSASPEASGSGGGKLRAFHKKEDAAWLYMGYGSCVCKVTQDWGTRAKSKWGPARAVHRTPFWERATKHILVTFNVCLQVAGDENKSPSTILEWSLAHGSKELQR